MRVDEITLREEYGTIAMDFDNGFGEMPGIVQVCEVANNTSFEVIIQGVLDIRRERDRSK